MTLTSAEVFERDLVPAVFRAWAGELVDLAAPKAGEHVLDLACGTGIVARVVRERVAPGRLVGLDFDPVMLRVAAAIDPGIEWVEGDAAALPFDAGEFGLVLCQQGLQFVPDRAKALSEVHRVLAPGGRLALGIWSRLETVPGHAVFFDELGKRLGPAAGRPKGWSLTDAKEVEALVRGAGFAEIALETRKLISRFPSARAFVQALLQGASKVTRESFAGLAEDDRAGFTDAVVARLAEFAEADGIALPMTSRLVVARRA